MTRGHDAPVVPVEEVRERLLRAVTPVTTEAVDLAAAAGRVVGVPIVAPTALPPESRAAMDGVAVRGADVAGAEPGSPAVLRVVGEVLAGAAEGPGISPGTCCRIATGAPLPPGADTVVRVERLSPTDDGTVVVSRPVPSGTDVRHAGEDASEGMTLVAAGRTLSTLALAGIAGAGVTEVEVRRRPRVTVLPTGDEVVRGGTPDALGPALSRLLTADGAAVTVAAPVPDDVDALVRALTTASSVSDLILTTGGVSIGPADLALPALEQAGTGEGLALALRPGRPFAYGRVGPVPVCCLPGNPAAALAVATVLVRPLVARLLGAPGPVPATARLASDLESSPGLRELVPAEPDPTGRMVRPLAGRGSGNLRRLAAATVLVDVAAPTTHVAAGTDVDVWWLP
jgi:molybdopterin molybdotransferase